MKRLRMIHHFIILIFLVACNSNISSVYFNTSNNPNSSENVKKEGISPFSTLAASRLIDEVDPLVKWEGRYEYKVGNINTPSMVYLYHTATGFTIDFYGTSLEVDFYTSMNDVIYYDYSIDDETLPNINNRRFSLSKESNYQTVVLVENLEEGFHSIKCLKQSEPRDSYTAIKEFRTDGKFMYREGLGDDDNLKFMFINASSGSGYGALVCTEGASTVKRTTENSSSLHSYMYLTARRFNADVHYVASAGWGVKYPLTKSISEVFDYTGVTPSNDVAGAKTTALWDYKKYVPDIIMMHIGGNDVDENDFNLITYQNAVVDLVSKLHNLYPLAKILWLHTNTNSGVYGITALEEVGAIRNGYLKEVIFPKVGAGESGNNTYGANSHHSFKSHIDASRIITNFITNTWNYKTLVEEITYEQFESIIDRGK